MFFDYLGGKKFGTVQQPNWPNMFFHRDSAVFEVNSDRFKIKCKRKGFIEKYNLTIRIKGINCSKGILPNKHSVTVKNGCTNIPILPGEYKVV